MQLYLTQYGVSIFTAKTDLRNETLLFHISKGFGFPGLIFGIHIFFLDYLRPVKKLLTSKNLSLASRNTLNGPTKDTMLEVVATNSPSGTGTRMLQQQI